MTRCAKFHHLFDEVGDFCGMSPAAISQYKAYREQVNKLVKLGIDEDFIFENFPEGPGRVLSNIKDDETRTKALNYVAGCLTRKEKVTEGDLRSTLKSWQESTGTACTVGKRGANLGARRNHFTNVKPVTPDTDEKPAPAGKPLSEVMVPAPDVPCGSSSFHTAAQELAATRGGIAGEMFPDGNYLEIPDSSIPAWTPALCKTGPCPDGRSHTTHDKVRGIVCEQTGQPINQISKCPIIIRMTAAEAGGFVPEGQPRPITDEHRPLRIVKTPLTDEEKKALADSFFERTGKTPKEIQQADELVSARYEGVKSRYELIDKAWSWFLAQAGGE